MGETLKPFPCNSAGCTMTFTNEDHLRVHEKKHDVDLHLGIESQGSTVDQTPTPTRFIRNCEEVGLFQDLQNVNPFDETFRKAAELVKCGGLHVPETSSDDSLHTPNVFPPQETVSDYGNKSSSLKDESFASNLPHKQSEDNNLSNILYNRLTQDKDQTTQLEQQFSSTPSSPDCVIISDIENEILHNDNKNSEEENREDNNKSENATKNEHNKLKYNVKNRLRETIKQKKTTSNVSAYKSLLENELKSQMVTCIAKIEDLQNESKNKNMPLILQKPRERIVRQEKTSSNSAKPKPLDKREMNRAAQSRSRERKKMWIRKMEADVDYLQKENKSLWLENQNLKYELNTLKKVLLRHKDCSVSQDPEIVKEISQMINMLYSSGSKENEHFQPQKKLKVVPIVPSPVHHNISAVEKKDSPILVPSVSKSGDNTTVSPIKLLVIPSVTVNGVAVNSAEGSIGDTSKIVRVAPVQAQKLQLPVNIQGNKSVKPVKDTSQKVESSFRHIQPNPNGVIKLSSTQLPRGNYFIVTNMEKT